MKKLPLVLLVVFVVLCLVIVTVGDRLIGGAIKIGIEAIGPEITQTTFEVDKVRINMLTGSGRVHGFTMGNPEGFKSDHSIHFEEARIHVAPFSILRGKVLIKKIHISGPYFIYERKLNKTNIRQILDNLEATTAALGKNREIEVGEDMVTDQSSASDEEDIYGDAALRFVIEELVIEKGQVDVSLLGAGMPLPLDRIEMRNIGSAEHGLPPEILFNEVVSQTFMKVTAAIGTLPIKSIVGEKE